ASLLFFFSSRRRHTGGPRDWSSDVCSSDLEGTVRAVNARAGTLELITGVGMSLRVVRMSTAPTTRLVAAGAAPRLADLKPGDVEIGRASCRERVWVSGVAVAVKRKEQSWMA